MSPALAGGFFTTKTTWEAHNSIYQKAKYNINGKFILQAKCL